MVTDMIFFFWFLFPGLLAEVGSNYNKPDRTMSPGGMSEDERRDLIARQRNALYGSDGSQFSETGSFKDGQTPRPGTQGSIQGASARGPSPLAFDPFGSGQKQGQAGTTTTQPTSEQTQAQQGSTSGPSPVQPQQRSRANSTSSPSSNPNSFSLFDNAAQQSSRTSTSSPGGSPPGQSGQTGKPAVGS